MIELLLFGLLVLGLASLHDMKTREVPDYLSYLFISTGVIFQVYSLAKNFDTDRLLFTAGNLGFSFVFGVVMYYKKQWGGADSKILLGLSLNLSGQANEWLFAYYFLNFLLVGAVYGIIGSFLVIVSNLKRFVPLVKQDVKEKREFYAVSLGISFIGIILILLNPLLGVICLIVGGLALVSLVLSKANQLMIKRVSVEKLTEGDWVVDKVVAGSNVLFDPKKEVDIKGKQIELMKKEGVKTVRIIEGMPFVPSFLIAYALTLASPGFFTQLVRGVVFSAF